MQLLDLRSRAETLFLKDLMYHKILLQTMCRETCAVYTWTREAKDLRTAVVEETHRISEAAVGQLVGFFVILGFEAFSKV